MRRLLRETEEGEERKGKERKKEREGGREGRSVNARERVRGKEKRRARKGFGKSLLRRKKQFPFPYGLPISYRALCKFLLYRYTERL